MSHYYNEFDPYAAQWLRNLINAGHLPAGEVDERSIVEVAPADLSGFRQCHFFAGIGGWAFAARLAGWPDDRELWTGSPPCQPFSAAGLQRGTADPRHLWPDFYRVINARRPAVVMGEQVAAAIGLHWLDRVRSDLACSGYRSRGIVLPACAVDAPQRRDRLWFVADRGSKRSAAGVPGSQPRQEGHAGVVDHGSRQDGQGAVACGDARHGTLSRVSGSAEGPRRSHWVDADNRSTWVIGHDGKARRVEPSIRLLADGLSARVGRLRAYGNAIVPQVAAEVIAAYMECAP